MFWHDNDNLPDSNMDFAYDNKANMSKSKELTVTDKRTDGPTLIIENT